MKEDNNLYFISILAKAFEGPDRATAFKNALSEIIRLGESAEYKKGFEQFEQFIASGQQSLSEDSDDYTRLRDMALQSLLTMLASETFDGPEEVRKSLIKRIQATPDLASRYQELLEELSPENEPSLEVELYKNDQLLGAQPLPSEQQGVYFDQIEPGNYSIRLSNGRVLWEGNVEAKDVIWELAHPEKEYPMAAATQKDESNQTKSIKLLKREMRLNFYAGMESGRIALFLTKDE
ncbi:hypothetical protein IID10_09785 [candidate division KSB1 bacterium]|nr:hypothetical protein [candidate division KSB1 bacterium]